MTKFLFFSSANSQAQRPITIFNLMGKTGHTGECFVVVNTDDPGNDLSMGLFIFICTSYISIILSNRLTSFGFPKVCQGCYYD